MSNSIPVKAIDTRYGGKLFRSRLEARWAVFFDTLGWKWEYEYEGYELPCGWYLPDFYFPDLKIFAEVKPVELNLFERRKCIELSLAFTDVPILLLIGLPDYTYYKTISNGGDHMDVVPMAKWEKYYPFYYTSSYDKYYFDETNLAIVAANEARFEHNKKS